MADNDTILYDDGAIRCDDRQLTIRRYYPWGDKRIHYTAMSGVEKMPLTGVHKARRWRIWGSGDFRHWWNLDTKRPHKDMALVIDVGMRIYPTITPDDPDAVERILSEHIINA